MLVFVIIATVAMIAFVAYFTLFKRYVIAKPNEWMLIIRSGEVLNYGIGISGWVGIDDKVVRFPSSIHKVAFSAQQVTTEMQGIEVSGVIIWTIYRESDGPLRAYKYLGQDISSQDPKNANDNLIEMTNGIVRHKIANSTIDHILKNRDKLREELKKELNESVNGWGVWLETVEITDVKILSGSLFKNLQTEFREAQRQKAEIIKMRTENELKEKKLAQNLEFAKKEAENEGLKQIMKNNEQLKINIENQKIFEQNQEIEKIKFNAENELKIMQSQIDNKFKELTAKNEHISRLNEMELTIEKEKKQQEKDAIEAETAHQQLQHDMIFKRKSDDLDREIERLNLLMKNEVAANTSFEVYALNTAKEIYSNLPMQDMKVFTFDNNKENPFGNLLGKVASQFQILNTEIPKA
jgi:flotillin